MGTAERKRMRFSASSMVADTSVTYRLSTRISLPISRSSSTGASKKNSRIDTSRNFDLRSRFRNPVSKSSSGNPIRFRLLVNGTDEGWKQKPGTTMDLMARGVRVVVAHGSHFSYPSSRRTSTAKTARFTVYGKKRGLGERTEGRF